MSDGENNVDGGVGDTAFYWKDGKPSEFTVSAKKAASKKGGERKAQIKASKPTERPHTIGDAISGDLVAAINHFVSQVRGKVCGTYLRFDSPYFALPIFLCSQ